MRKIWRSNKIKVILISFLGVLKKMGVLNEKHCFWSSLCKCVVFHQLLLFFILHMCLSALFSKPNPIKWIRYSTWKLESKSLDSLENHIDLILREKILQWANIGWLIDCDIAKHCHIHYCIILILKTLIGIKQCISV